MTFYDEYVCISLEHYNIHIIRVIERGTNGYSHYEKTKLNKSAIYVGGGLQLMFGVMGTRWENNPMWKQIIHTEGCKFIRPSDSETCSNQNSIEGGCYW